MRNLFRILAFSLLPTLLCVGTVQADSTPEALKDGQHTIPPDDPDPA